MNQILSKDDIQKAVMTALEAPSEDVSREIMAMAGVRPDRIEKAITTGSGLVAYDLQAPAKNLYPVNTPIIKSLPRVSGGIGTAANWRVVSAITGSGYDASGWVPEGQRAGQMSYTTSNASASYSTIGEEDQATWEAIVAGRTFEDLRATMTTRLLQKMMLKEEMAVLFGNNSAPLGTVGTVTTTAPTLAGSTLAAQTSPGYSVICVALSGEGYKNSSIAGGVAVSKTITGADGKTFTINGGSSMKSAQASQIVTSGQSLNVSVAAIQGAVAYAWYVGATIGAETLQRITTINSTVFSTPISTGNQNASAITADTSTNTTAFNGLLTTALKAGSGAYVNSLATGTVGTGTVLTASNKGSCVEIDTMLQAMWDQNQVSVTELWVNSQEMKNITSRVLTGSSNASLLSYRQDPGQGEYHMTAGGMVDFYFNPFLNGGRRIPVRIHPNMPAGTILGYATDLPIQYQSNEVPHVAEIKTRRDYYQIDWPVTTRADMVGVYSEETLAIYAPFALGVITNIANG